METLNKYKYKSIYDESEIKRIDDLLNTQRDVFIKEDEKQLGGEQKALKIGVLVVGATVLLLIFNKIVKWKIK